MNIYREQLLGKGDHGWLKSNFHFSFAQYHNKDRDGYGALLVLNDDRVSPETGFDTHPHKDMEIISYVVEGKLSHKDSMGSEETLNPGEIQYMSAGKGVSHSEYNRGDETLRFLQIWIAPDKQGHTPNYGSKRVPMDRRRDRWLHLVSPKSGNGEISINQDANIYSTILTNGKSLTFDLKPDRMLYGVIISGKVEVESEKGVEFLSSGDGFDSETKLIFGSEEESHILIVELKR